MEGIPILREKISEKIFQLYGRKYKPGNEITITSGATQALYTAITSVVSKGDEVIIFEPAYDSYAPAVMLSGGMPVFVPLNKDYSIGWGKVKDKITRKTKAIIINSPHNPTGSVISMEDIKYFEEITTSSDIVIISDEVYEHIVFDGLKHISISQSEALSKRSFVISSFGKTYHTTGWKMGYCAAPENLMKEFRKIHQFIVFSVNTPVQYAYAEFLENKNHYLSLNNFYEKKRDLLLSKLNNSDFKFSPSKGTYFQLLNYSAISEADDIKFTEYLTKEIKVASIPLSPFISSGKASGLIRLCFAKRDEILIEAAGRLNNIKK
jgi:methionine aminotransferase